jgi:predicted transcriptional regulator
MKASKTIAIGVMPQAKLREHVLAIARGDYRPKASDPKIWFTSMKTAASVLSDENRALLRAIAATQPASIAALAAETGANVRRVSRTLKTLSHYGLVDLQPSGKSLRPVPKSKQRGQNTFLGRPRGRSFATRTSSASMAA